MKFSLPESVSSFPVKYTLPAPSDEQNEIISIYSSGFNLKVNAVAGAGKTTTLLLLANEAKIKYQVKTLILTYNRELKDEISQRIQEVGLKGWCWVYTFHGFLTKISGKTINNNILLRQHLQYNYNFETLCQLVCVDEVQDMSDECSKLVNKIISHAKSLVLVGDERQCIYDYIDADLKYFRDPDKYFNTGRPWKELSLRTSYRLTPSIATFVNKAIICEKDLIIAGNNKNKDLKPQYRYGEYSILPFIKEAVSEYGCEEVVI